MPSPDTADAVHQWQAAVGRISHVHDTKVIAHEGPRQTGIGQANEEQVQMRGGPCESHPACLTGNATGDWHGRQQHGHQQTKNQCEMSEFRQHR